jgi:hypothetical protein
MCAVDCSFGLIGPGTRMVFAFELMMIREKLGLDVAREWVMAVRKPGYFRDFGLKIDPGKKDLLEELKKILMADVFSKEFGQEEYQAIMGIVAKEKEVAKESAQESVHVGKEIEGKIAGKYSEVL